MFSGARVARHRQIALPVDACHRTKLKVVTSDAELAHHGIEHGPAQSETGGGRGDHAASLTKHPYDVLRSTCSSVALPANSRASCRSAASGARRLAFEQAGRHAAQFNVTKGKCLRGLSDDGSRHQFLPRVRTVASVGATASACRRMRLRTALLHHFLLCDLRFFPLHILHPAPYRRGDQDRNTDAVLAFISFSYGVQAPSLSHSSCAMAFAKIAHHSGEALQFSLFVFERHRNCVGPESRFVLSGLPAFIEPYGFRTQSASPPLAPWYRENRRRRRENPLPSRALQANLARPAQ